MTEKIKIYPRMKKYAAADIPSASIAPFTLEPFSRPTRRKIIKKLNPVPPPPNEETINKLNGIGHEYPFCVYYKTRSNDPL
jgi:hypothetical protein